MNSKQALQNIRDYHDETVIDNYCTYVENDFEEELDTIEKDLEILEIIKRWSFIQEGYKEGYGPYTKFQCIIHTIGMEEDFKKVKEWLEEWNCTN